MKNLSHRGHRGHRGHNDFSVPSVPSVAIYPREIGNQRRRIYERRNQ